MTGTHAHTDTHWKQYRVSLSRPIKHFSLQSKSCCRQKSTQWKDAFNVCSRCCVRQQVQCQRWYTQPNEERSSSSLVKCLDLSRCSVRERERESCSFAHQGCFFAARNSEVHDVDAELLLVVAYLCDSYLLTETNVLISVPAVPRSTWRPDEKQIAQLQESMKQPSDLVSRHWVNTDTKRLYNFVSRRSS